MTDNRWIVSTKKFVEHNCIDIATAEMARLQEKFPQKKFRLYRVKRVVESTDKNVKRYLTEAIASFEGDPEDTEFLEGYLAALQAVYEDNFLTQEERATFRRTELAARRAAQAAA